MFLLSQIGFLLIGLFALICCLVLQKSTQPGLVQVPETVKADLQGIPGQGHPLPLPWTPSADELFEGQDWRWRIWFSQKSYGYSTHGMYSQSQFCRLRIRTIAANSSGKKPTHFVNARINLVEQDIANRFL